MIYRWGVPGDWLIDQAKTWEPARVYQALVELVKKVDSDTIQDLFQDEMDADGYFTNEDSS